MCQNKGKQKNKWIMKEGMWKNDLVFFIRNNEEWKKMEDGNKEKKSDSLREIGRMGYVPERRKKKK